MGTASSSEEKSTAAPNHHPEEKPAEAVYDPRCIYWDDEGHLRLGHNPRDRTDELLKVVQYIQVVYYDCRVE